MHASRRWRVEPTPQANFERGAFFYASLEEFVGALPRNRRNISQVDSFARKLIIPVSERPNILRELSRMNINSASLFPGMDG
jgi:hypothetical protein